jgi:hypothetical protein
VSANIQQYGGGSVMYLGAILAEGVGQPVCVNRTMNLVEYLTILDGNLQQSALKLGLKRNLVL